MQPGYELKSRIIHLPHGKTVVSCSGLHIRDQDSSAASPDKPAWGFSSPKDGPRLGFKIKANSLSNMFKEAEERLVSAGYVLPSGFGLVAGTNLTNITIKSRVIQVRINVEGADSQRFSFQFDRFSFTSYDDAMQNALKLRDLLISQRADNHQLREGAKKAAKFMRALSIK